MRVPAADLPRRPLGLRGWLIGAAVLIVVLLLSLRGSARFYTDYLWFQEVGFTDTWRGLLSAKAVPALIFSSVFFAFMLVNLVIADRIAPRYRTAGPEDEIIERYRTYVAPYAGRLRVIVAGFFALIMGGGVSAEWQSWILFSNAVDFGVDDPQFNRDIGFYMFRLPFLQFAVGWIFAALLVVLIVVAVFHYLNGGIRLQSPWQRVTPQVKVHLSVILALMALTKTAQYYLARFELVFSRRGFVDGASYTDVKAQLPALNLLMIISIAAAVLFVANIWRRGWVFPVIAVGLWAFISLVVGTIYPAVIQRFVVQPNELSREQVYIERNIEATRQAFGLDETRVRVEDFDYVANLTQPDVAANADTFSNVRLWDPVQLRAVYRATQEIQPFYAFVDVDVDRYDVGEQQLTTFVAPRELDAANIPDRTWTNRHLVYTHGFGAVAAAGNAATAGEPSYLLRGIEPSDGELAPLLEQPGVYFGENVGGYAIVDTKVAEQQASRGDGVAETRYEGEAGVEISNLVRRAALALRFGDWNLFVSGQLDGNSRVLYKRDIRDRVETAAPFLRFDADPYPVLLDGRMIWVIDGYTTSDQYPYSQSIRPRNLPNGSGLDTDFNYIRNSVKATVDGYDGTVRFYIVDEDDPIIRVYARAFPELFSDVDDMPDGLIEHWRYPEDLFRAQTEQYTLYHMQDPEEFFRRQFIWDIAPQPEASEEVTAAPTTVRGGSDGGRNTTLRASDDPVDPLYLTMALPGETTQEFLLLRPFAPRAKANQLSAFMVARADPEHYGELVLYELPENLVAPSPLRASQVIQSSTEISEQFTLLDRAGSEVLLGDVQLLPIGESVVYIRPVYVRPEGQNAYPRLRFVAVSYAERATLADLDPDDSSQWSRSVIDAVEELLRPGTTTQPDEPAEPDEPDGPDTTTTTTAPPTTTTTTPGSTPEGEPTTAEGWLDVAAEAFAEANAALREGDFAGYERAIDRAELAVMRARELSADAASTTTAPPISGAGFRRP